MRAYQKKVVFLKETGSKIFEEACFVLRTGGDYTPSHATMVAEAKRIIEENFTRRVWRKRGFLKISLSFLFGFLSAFLIFRFVF